MKVQSTCSKLELESQLFKGFSDCLKLEFLQQ